MLEYVLIVSELWEGPYDTYAGSFDSCDSAQTHYEEELQSCYAGSSCLHEDYIILPEGFEHGTPLPLCR